MDKEIAKAFSDLNQKIIQERKKDKNILGGRCDNNAAEIKLVSNNVDDTTEILLGTEEALDYVVGEVLPLQAEKNEDLENTIDYILTDILPLIMGDE